MVRKLVYIAGAIGVLVGGITLATISQPHEFASVQDPRGPITAPLAPANPQQPDAGKDMPEWWYDPAGIRCAGPQCD